MSKVTQVVPPISSIKDENTRRVLEALLQNWRVRNGDVNPRSSDRFITAAEVDGFIDPALQSFPDSGTFRQAVRQTVNNGGAIGPGAFQPGLTAIGIVDELPPVDGYKGPTLVYLTTDGKLYRYTGSAWTAVSADAGTPGTDQEYIAIYSALPNPVGYTGPTIAYLTTDGKLYAYDSTVPQWTSVVSDAPEIPANSDFIGIYAGLPTVSGYTGPTVILNTDDDKLYQLTGGAWVAIVANIPPLDNSDLASGLETVSVVSSLPSPTGYTGSRLVFLTTDNKLYRYNGTSFVASVPTTDLSGTIITNQIADFAVTAAKIDNLAVTNAKIADATITAAKISSINADTITTGTLNAGLFAANSIAASKINTNNLTIKDSNGVVVFSASVPLTGAYIANATITDANIASLSADKITAGSLNAARIDARNLIIRDAAGNPILGVGSPLTGTWIANATITDANIGSLSADKITTGQLTAARIDSRNLTIKDGAGNIIFGSGMINGQSANQFVSTTNRISSLNINTFIDGVAITDAYIANLHGAKITASTVTADKLSVGSLSAVSANLGTVTSGWVNTASDGSGSYGGVRSLNKWINDGGNGFVLAREPGGASFMEFRGGTAVMRMTSWGDNYLAFGSNFSVDSTGNLVAQNATITGNVTANSLTANVVNTNNIVSDAVTVPRGASCGEVIIFNIDVAKTCMTTSGLDSAGAAVFVSITVDLLFAYNLNFGSGLYDYLGIQLELTRNGTLIRTFYPPGRQSQVDTSPATTPLTFTVTYLDPTPPNGANQYAVVIRRTQTQAYTIPLAGGGTIQGYGAVRSGSLFAIGAKR